jgi:hypothetical protein
MFHTVRTHSVGGVSYENACGFVFLLKTLLHDVPARLRECRMISSRVASFALVYPLAPIS